MLKQRQAEVLQTLKDRNVLVTGGAGFIGSHLAEQLVEKGANVTTADYKPMAGLDNLAKIIDRIDTYDIDFVTGDICSLMASKHFDVIFHLAGSAHVQSSVEDPQRDFARNALATVRLLDAVRTTSPSTAIIYTSSAVVYRGGGTELISEDAPTHPQSPYGVSKLASDRYVSVFAHVYGMQTAVARLFTVYGPRLRKQIVWDVVHRLLAQGHRLPMLGDAGHMRDCSYVDDIVQALLLIATKAPLCGEAYNLASGNIVTVEHLAKTIASAMNLSPVIEFAGAGYTGDTSHWFANTDRLRALGYAPRVTLEEGISRTVNWIVEDARAASMGVARS